MSRKTPHWGTVPRFFEPRPRVSTPGPGEYDLSQHSLGVDNLQASTVHQGSRPKSRGVPRVKKQPKKTGFATVMTESSSSTTNKNKKNERQSRPKTSMSSFGSGRDCKDSWGRDTPLDIPGPGTYDLNQLQGTFSCLEQCFEDESYYPERSYLNMFKSRINKIQELEKKHETKGLGIIEKVLLKQETDPRRLKRLHTKKKELEDVIQKKREQKEKLLRPRSTSVLVCNGPYGRNSFKFSRMKSVESLHYIAPTKGPKSKTVSGLLSAYKFGNEQNLPSRYQEGLGVCTTIDSDDLIPNNLRCEDDNESIILSSETDDRDKKKKRKHRRRKSSTIGGGENPQPWNTDVRPRSLRKPTFWQDPTTTRLPTLLLNTTLQSKSTVRFSADIQHQQKHERQHDQNHHDDNDD